MMNDFAVTRYDSIGEKYYYKKHKSGLDIYIVPKPFSTAYALFGTKYGSVDTRFRRADEQDFVCVPDGIAHYLEHKMFESEDGTDAFSRFARTGASANAYTSFLQTAYLFSCTDNFDESLSILLDFVTHPYFTKENVEKEQGIIAQEIRMRQDNPDSALLFSLLEAMYQKHHVRIEIAGSVDSIAQIDADLLYRCYNTFYNLNNMALCVCGNITPEEVEAVCDRVLTPSPAFNVISEQEAEPETVKRKLVQNEMQVAFPLFAVGIKDTQISSDPVERAETSAAMEIIGNMLFGETSPYFNELYREGLLNGPLGTWCEHNRSHSFLMFDGESRDPQAVYDRFLAYIDRVLKDGLDEDDFLRARRTLYAQNLKAFDSTSEIANGFLSCVFDGYDMMQYTDISGRITKEKTEEILRRLFREEHYARSIVNPISQ